ncbi:hypothetical protein PIROE2DRAFT_63063 [Piromyces sp. E2]|nr:hypothetical protein PIROE2DRAFT_63063 [Piromyces sp. E2]|eukprot:OUM60565.1 hypothetical protein PIROE2DRAFT_63063 [Piromyces sp. E2]
MNSKSLIFIFALLALFTLASANAVPEKRDLEDDELLSDALSLMQKLLKSKEAKEKQKIVESLDVDEEDVKDEIEIEDEEEEPVINNNTDEKYIVNDDDIGMEENYNNEDIGPEFEEVEVITVTVEVDADEDGNVVNNVDGAKAMQGEINDDSVEVVEGDGEVQVEEVNADIIGEGEEQPDINVDVNGLNVVDADVQVDDSGATVEYEVDENNLENGEEQVTYYYTVESGKYIENEDVFEGVVTNVDTVDNEQGEQSSGKGGIIGGTVAVVSAFGLIAGFGYKYHQRNKRVLLPFHEDLEKGEFFDKNSAEQHIIPVWAATVKKEENEEEKEDEEKLFEVVYNYEPELPDELKLTVGDKIKIKEIYEDGWAYGYNKTTQLFGTFPSTSLGENFNPESVPQYKPEEVAVEMNDNMVEELKKKIVESN